jgi:hypothetical protein
LNCMPLPRKALRELPFKSAATRRRALSSSWETARSSSSLNCSGSGLLGTRLGNDYGL